MTLRERIRKELAALSEDGKKLVGEIKQATFNHFTFSERYQVWYPRALRVVADHALIAQVAACSQLAILQSLVSRDSEGRMATELEDAS